MFTYDPAFQPLADAVAARLAITQAAAAKRLERLACNYAQTHGVDVPAAIAFLERLGDGLAALVAEGPHEQVRVVTPAEVADPGTHAGVGGHVEVEPQAGPAGETS